MKLQAFSTIFSRKDCSFTWMQFLASMYSGLVLFESTSFRISLKVLISETG